MINSHIIIIIIISSSSSSSSINFREPGARLRGSTAMAAYAAVYVYMYM